MTSLFVDIGMLVGVLGYSFYLITLLLNHKNGSRFEVESPVEHQAVNWLSWAPINNGKTSLAFQRVGRRV